MFNVKVSKDIIEYSQEQVKKYNFGQRSHANGNKEEQTTGVIGQCVVMGMFGAGLVDGSTGFDNGIDIDLNGIGIDVKTMGRTCYPSLEFTNNLMGSQVKYDGTDAYIFCSYHKTEEVLTVCGWIPKSDALKVARHFPKGAIRTRTDGTTFPTKAEMYEIDNKDLYRADSVEDLQNSIMSYYQELSI